MYKRQPLLTASPEAHARILAWAAGRRLALSGHALVETYTVLTKLPGSARVDAHDAARLIDDNFERLLISEVQGAEAHHDFARLGIPGGAVYDALVALAALRGGTVLATRNVRARDTYEAIRVRVPWSEAAGAQGRQCVYAAPPLPTRRCHTSGHRRRRPQGPRPHQARQRRLAAATDRHRGQPG